MDDEQPRLNDVVRDAKKLAEDVARLVDHAKEQGGAMASRVREEGAARLGEAREKMRHAARETDEYAREHVWTTAAIAGLIGMVFGSFLFRRRRDD